MNGKLDVEVHNGRVVSVWLNCQLLPFEQVEVDAKRAEEMANHNSGIITDRVQISYEADASPVPSVWDRSPPRCTCDVVVAEGTWPDENCPRHS